MNERKLIIDNSYIVSHNLPFSIYYKAHINVEVVYSIKAVQYLNKYIMKGLDKTMITINGANSDHLQIRDQIES